MIFLFVCFFEDIIETGRTMKALLSKLKDKEPKMIRVVRYNHMVIY